MEFDLDTETITPIKQSVLTIGGAAGINTPSGTTAERPGTPVNGVIRYNTDGANFEGYENGNWISFSGINNVNSARYNSLTNNQTASNPGNGRIKWNNATQINSTQIYMSSITQDGVDITQFLLKVQLGSIFWVQISNNSSRYQRWQLDSITNNTGWFTFGVTLLDSLDAQYNNNTSLVVAITSTGTGLVNSFSGGTTGFTPNTPTTGAVTLAGTLNVTNGGTGLSTLGAANRILGVNTAGTALEYKTVTAGAGITITPSAGAITIASTATGTVTSVSGSGGATGLTLLGGPITTSGTLTIGGVLSIASGGTGESNAIDAINGLMPAQAGNAGRFLTTNGTDIAWSAAAPGTVTSVGLALPSIFSVSGSPVTTSGTLTGTLATQSANTFFVGPVSGGPAAPTFRTVGIDELSDVVITSPASAQVVSYNGTNWVNSNVLAGNATGTVGVSPSGGGTAWTLVSGNQYRADFVHNLGTTNVVVTCWDTNTNAIVIPNSVVTLNTTTVRITVTGNTRTIKVVVVANGAALVAGGSTPSSVITAYEGVTISAAATKLNFQGQAVGVTDAGAGTTNITIGSRFTFFANSLDTPVNSDFAINSIAATVTDPTYASLNVRSFSNTTEQGVACLVSIPTGATTMTVKIRGRAQTAPGVASVVQPRLYARLLPNNSAVGAWSAAKELTNISIPTNANFQYYTYSATLSSLTLTAGNLYQFEFTRRTAGVTGTNLAANFLMAEITVEFA